MKLLEIYRELIMEAYTSDSSIMIYYVKFETSFNSEILYKGIDKAKAMKVFDGFDDVPKHWDDNMYLVMEGVVSHYKFIEDDDIEYYPIDDYYNDNSIYKLISTEEPITINRHKVNPPNKDSDEVLDAVQDYFQNKYGKRKYNRIMIGDKCINLRIADHTENIMNIDKYGDCEYHISVVISNLDKTIGKYWIQNKMDRRKNEYELKFNSGDKIGDIIMEINNLINFLKTTQN